MELLIIECRIDERRLMLLQLDEKDFANLGSGGFSGIAFMAHVGGFLTGIGVAKVIFPRRDLDQSIV